MKTITAFGVPTGRATYVCKPWIVVTVPVGVPPLTKPVRQSGQEMPILDIFAM
jgi:hypothetical protein